MNILVTGGNGNVGRVTVAELMEAGHAVRVFDAGGDCSAGAEFVQGDLREPDAVDRAAAGMDAIVHLGAIPALKPGIPFADFMDVNVKGTANVCEAAGAHGVPKVVFASSDSSLGFVFATHPHAPDYLPIDEAHPRRPQDAYGLSKLLGEEICQAASRRYGLEAICLRLCWVWFADTYPSHAAIVRTPMEELRKGLWGYVDVRDVAQACRRSVERAFHPGTESMYITAADTYMDVPSAELAAAAFPEVPRAADYFDEEKYRTFFDISRARERLGYVPRHTWRDNVG